MIMIHIVDTLFFQERLLRTEKCILILPLIMK